MIQEFVTRFDAARPTLLAKYKAKAPASYAEIVRDVVEIVGEGDEYERPDPERITAIDHGDYQGTQLFVIASNDYQPRTFWYVMVSYGSCSSCDTLQGIRNYTDEPPTDEQASDYLTLALHIVQGLKKMGEAQ